MGELEDACEGLGLWAKALWESRGIIVWPLRFSVDIGNIQFASMSEFGRYDSYHSFALSKSLNRPLS